MSNNKDDIKFDKHIRNEYANHGVAPPENLWLAIDSEASKLEAWQLKKRTLFYKWLALSIFIMLVGVSTLYLYDLNTKKAQLSLNNTPNKVENITNKITSPTKPAAALLNKDKAITLVLKQKTPLITTPKNAIKNTQIQIIKNTSQAVNKQKYTAKKHSKTPLKITPLKNKKETNSTLKQDVIIANSKPVTTKEPLNQANNKTIAAVNSKPPTLPIVKTNKLAVPTNKYEKENFTNSKMDLIIPLTPNFALISDENTTKTLNNTTHFPPVALVPAKILSRISISAFVAPTFSSRFLRGNSAAFYNKKEKGNFVYNGGFDIGYQVANNWIIRLGANYGQLSQNINITNSKEQYLPIDIDTTNNTITIFSELGTVKTAELDELDIDNDDNDLFNYKETQDFKFVNIPVFVAYELGKRKLKFVFQVGGEANLTVQSSSKIAIANAKNTHAIKLDVLTKTKTLNFSGYAGIGAKYLLTPKISLIIIPTYKMFFTNLSKDNTAKINPYSFSVSTGLQYHF